MSFNASRTFAHAIHKLSFVLFECTILVCSIFVGQCWAQNAFAHTVLKKIAQDAKIVTKAVTIVTYGDAIHIDDHITVNR